MCCAGIPSCGKVFTRTTSITPWLCIGGTAPRFSPRSTSTKKKLKTVDGSGDWDTDSRIGDEHQLNNDYYANNPWDRGHLARRASTAWGDSRRDALRASDETFYYSNAALQHKNFNRDEWVALEDWVKDLKLDQDDKISVFSGPVFADYMRAIRPVGRDPAYVPSAFFKVVFFMNNKKKMEVRAFLVPQDNEALSDMRGRRTFNNQTYQVSIAEIEALTGLVFPAVLPERNPLFFTPSDEARDGANVHEFPERREVNGPTDIVRDNTRPRDLTFADDLDVFIAAAMVNPKGRERDGEWISIANLTAKKVSIKGWTLKDHDGSTIALSGSIAPGEAKRIQPISPLALPNAKASHIQLIDDTARQVDRVTYTKAQASREGKPVVFAYREIGYDLPRA